VITIIYGHVGSVCSVVMKKAIGPSEENEELEFIRYGNGCMVMRKWAGMNLEGIRVWVWLDNHELVACLP
jgi:hypothetical protein